MNAPGPKASVGQTALAPPIAPPPLRIQRDTYRQLIYALLVMSVSRIHQHFPFLRPLRPLLLVTVLAAIYAYLNPRFLASGSVTRTWAGKCIIGLGIAACASVPFGLSIGGSGRFILEEFSKTLILAVLVIVTIRNARDLYTIVWALVVGEGCLAYLSLFVFKMRKGSADGLLRIANGYSYDANDLATVAVAGLGLAFLAYQASRGRARTAALVVMLGIGGTIAKSGSRGGFLGLVAFVGAMLFLVRSIPVTKKLVFIAVTGLALAIAAPPGYWKQMQTILNPQEDYNWDAPNGRRQLMIRGFGYFMRNPVTGIGVDNFPRAEGTISDRAIAQAADPSLAGIKWSVPHNSFLEAMVEMGLPGIVLFGGLVAGGIFKTYKLSRTLPRHWAKGDPEEQFLYLATLYLPVCFVTFLVAGFFVSFTYYDLPYILGALTAGLYVAIEEKLKRSAGVAPAAPAPQRTVPLRPPDGAIFRPQMIPGPTRRR